MDALLSKDPQTREVAKKKLLGDLAEWFESRGQDLNAETLYLVFFQDADGKKLKPDLKLDDGLLVNKGTGLKAYLGVLLSNPAQVMRDHPEIVKAVVGFLSGVPALLPASIRPVQATAAQRPASQFSRG